MVMCLFGKTTTAGAGLEGRNDNPVDGVTNNPWNPDKTAAGSSRWHALRK